MKAVVTHPSGQIDVIDNAERKFLDAFGHLFDEEAAKTPHKQFMKRARQALNTLKASSKAACLRCNQCRCCSLVNGACLGGCEDGKKHKRGAKKPMIAGEREEGR